VAESESRKENSRSRGTFSAMKCFPGPLRAGFRLYQLGIKNPKGPKYRETESEKGEAVFLQYCLSLLLMSPLPFQ
jgi:hypothetical protein